MANVITMNGAGTDAVPGLRKAAILLVQMGKEASAKILGQMRESEVEEITAEIVRLRNLDPTIADSVVEEFHELVKARRYVGQGGLAFAQEVLEASMGAEKARDLVARLSASFSEMPFHFLSRADPRQILSFLSDEHPQTIALVLAHLRSDQASIVLSGLSPDVQADVAHRIATMEQTSPEVIRTVESMFERRMSSVLAPQDMMTVGGLQPLVDIINRADRGTERLILEGLERRDPQLAEEVRSRMFMFEDIVTLDDKAIQLVLRQVEAAELATALKGVAEPVRDKIMRNLSERAAENLRDEIEMLGPVRLRTVEESQAKIVQAIRMLEESGQITVRRTSDDEFVD
ncbi:MAG: flagellar motor switch protein FliG [Actinomycetales bacterium]